MKRIIFISIFTVLAINSFAQTQKRLMEFILPISEQSISNSSYSYVQLIDKRNALNKKYLGTINDYTVVVKPGLSVQISKYVNDIIAGVDRKDTMVVVLRKLALIRRFEKTSRWNEETYFNVVFQADIYEKSGNLYLPVESYDQVERIKSRRESKILDFSSQIFANAIVNNLTKKGNTDRLLNYTEIISPDSIAKRDIYIYNNPEYKNGLYFSYDSFKNQIPDDTLANVSIRRNIIKFKGNKKPTGIYALVINKRPFIATDVGFYPLQFADDNFTFEGKFTTKYPDILIVPGLMFSFIMTSYGKEYLVRLNHTDGKFILLRRLDAFFNKDDELLW
ncbi:MAG: hypothetical protein LBI82_07405 [Dysgonamonadaceae bacterium]|nr:hypothetical protein [Dysgonamonadaceae bacterium]